MADLTAKRTWKTKGPTRLLAGLPAASTTFYAGELLVANASGLLEKPTDAATKIPMGIFTGEGVDAVNGDDFLTTPSSGQGKITVETGWIWCPFASAAQADVGDVFYLADSATVTKTAGSKTIGLRCLEFMAGYVLLDFDHPLGML